MKLSLVIFLGMTDKGIFPGSRVSTNSDELYEHPVIEAHRNLINFKLNNESTVNTGDIIEQRSMYFGQNKKLAFEQIEIASKTIWPEPQLSLLKNLKPTFQKYFFTVVSLKIILDGTMVQKNDLFIKSLYRDFMFVD